MVELSDIINSSNVACNVDVSSKKKALHHLALILSYAVNNPGERFDANAGGDTAADSEAGTLEDTGELDNSGDHSDEEQFSEMDILDALISRERLGSTALGQGIAVPHGRLTELERPVAAMITLAEGIEFDAPDEEPVDIIFALLVPEDSTDEHLRILSVMAEKFSNESIAATLRQCDGDQVQRAHEVLCQGIAAN